jgi:hypothetical protein
MGRIVDSLVIIVAARLILLYVYIHIFHVLCCVFCIYFRVTYSVHMVCIVGLLETHLCVPDTYLIQLGCLFRFRLVSIPHRSSYTPPVYAVI